MGLAATESPLSFGLDAKGLQRRWLALYVQQCVSVFTLHILKQTLEVVLVFLASYSTEYLYLFSHSVSQCE